MSLSLLFLVTSNIIYVNSQLSRNPLTDRTDSTGQTLTSNEGPWGSWGAMKYCDEGQWLKTIEFRSESDQGNLLDDVAGVGVALICEEPDSTTEYRYEYRSYSSPHNWGSWYGTNPATCPSGSWVIGFRTNIERWCYDRGCNVFSRPQCCGVDDTSLNCIQLICSDGQTVLTPTDCRNWGDGYPSSYSQCNNGYICGWRERFEEDEAVDDETGLNAVRFGCCDYTDSPTKSPTPAPTRNPTPAPTRNPTPSPTRNPTPSPTKKPTLSPTTNPSHAPTNNPSVSPTINPSQSPTNIPSASPSDDPTESPSPKPSPNPTSSTPSPTELTYPPTTSPIVDAAVVTNAGSSSVVNNGDTTINHKYHGHELMPLWIILGIILGMLCCLCIILIIGYFWWKNRKSKQSVHEVQRVRLQDESPMVDEHEDDAEMVMSIGMEGINEAGTKGTGTRGITKGQSIYNGDRQHMTAGGDDDDVDEDLLPKEDVVDDVVLEESDDSDGDMNELYLNTGINSKH